MEWKDLSREAKAILEWVINPFDKKKETVEIQVGTNFTREIPKDKIYDGITCDVPITKKLFSEIIKYVASDNNLETVSYDANTKKFAFKMKDDAKI